MSNFLNKPTQKQINQQKFMIFNIDQLMTTSDLNLFKKRFFASTHSIWCVDETFFSKNAVLFVLICIKTSAILGTIFTRSTSQEIQAETLSEAILELYENCLENYREPPVAIHSDNKPTYWNNEIYTLCEEHNIACSTTQHFQFGNNEIESVNNTIKNDVIKYILQHYSTNLTYKTWRKNWPSEYKHIKKTTKVFNKEFKEFLFNSEWFKTSGILPIAIQKAIQTYNSRHNKKSNIKLSREEQATCNQFIKPPSQLFLANPKSIDGQVITESNDHAFLEAQNKVSQLLQSKLTWQEKEIQLNQLVIHTPDLTNTLIVRGFTYVIQQNTKLLNELDEVKKECYNVTNKLQKLQEYNEELLKEKKLKEEKRLKRLNRQRQEPKQPFLIEHYELLMKSYTSHSYVASRNRLAFTILAITGIRFAELLPIKIKQIKTLWDKGFMPIHRIKRGPSNKKAFLSKKGKELLKKREADFIYILENHQRFADFNKLNIEDLLLFTNQNQPTSLLSRSHWNNALNEILKTFSTQQQLDTKYTTHSFRHNFIQSIWKDSKDILYVKEVIGHGSIKATEPYLRGHTEEEMRILANKRQHL